MVGIAFAATEGGPTVENSLNSSTGNTTQLLLTGTLFSQNTLGGSIITKDSDGKNYFLPWGTTADQHIARQYDLHYVRRYQPDLDPTNGTTPPDNITYCAPLNGAASSPDCDLNENAFVIRIDRKASVSPPPGFESSGDIVR